MILQSPQDKILVTVKSKYTKDFGALTKRFAIEQGTSVHLEDLVSITGTVYSLPKEITKEKQQQGYGMEEIRVGDQLIFSFSVIYDFYQKTHEGEIIHRNRLNYKGKDYWLADITKIFAIIRGDEIIMINGFVMASRFAENRLFTQPEYKTTRISKCSELLHIGSPRTTQKKIKAKPGDTVYYNPAKVQKYEINGKPFLILNQHQVLGRKVN